MDKAQEQQTNKKLTFGDEKSGRELQRLVLQDAMFTDIFTPLIPPPLESATAPMRILDIACGPGIWATRVAKAHPLVHITCIDNDEAILEYARLYALGEGISNITFVRADYYHLDQVFSQAQFDFAHVRQVLWLLGSKGKDLVQQWSALVKPGGMMRLTDWEASTTNSPSFNQLTAYLMEAIHAHGLSDSKYRIGLVYKLVPYLRSAGFSQIVEAPHYVNFSAGTKFHNMYVQDITQGAITLQPLIVGSKVVTAEAYEECMRKSIEEIDNPHFLGGHFFLSTWGSK